jgi:hypothetical protein
MFGRARNLARAAIVESYARRCTLASARSRS